MAEHGLEQAAIGHALLQRIGHRARLLVDFLEHEMLELALLRGLGRQFADPDGAFHRVAAGIQDADRLAAHFRDVAFLQELEAARHRQQRGRVRRNEVFAFTVPDHHRATHAREDEPVRLRFAQHHQRIGAFKFRDRGAHCLEQVAQGSHVVVDAMRDDLGVGLGRELVAQLLEFAAQLHVVFDDAVVHHRQPVA